MSVTARTAGIVAANGTGFASAFALASCCALPMGLAAIGLGSSWLVPLVMATDPYSTPLRVVALACIVLGVVPVIRAARTCAPGDLCARRGFRFSIYAVAVVNAVLLGLSFLYE